MKISKIEIENFRLLKEFSIDLEDELSLVIGKNNTGKTSLLTILDRFLNESERTRFSFDDFNLDFRGTIRTLIQKRKLDEKITPVGIKLKLYIEYDEKDDLSNVSKVMMDLDPAINTVVLGFEYSISYKEILQLKQDFKEFKVKGSSPRKKDLSHFLKENHADYFRIHRKSFLYDSDKEKPNELVYLDLRQEKISLNKILRFKYISARRDVTNKEVDKSLSTQISKLYKRKETNEAQLQAIEEFKESLLKTDSNLSEIYGSIFEQIIKKVRQYGGVAEGDSLIKIMSTLQHRELLDGNTTVMYGHQKHELPEHYNGLGYMNLISMIFDIEILINEFKTSQKEDTADINLLFIEEPEAHTHPQMQYVFIKNIKALLKEEIKITDENRLQLQYVISTHSSHIVSESHFDDIKYLIRQGDNHVISKNVKALEDEYGKDQQEQNYRFLKQYLTLNRAELFFADKAILIEGDTERILLPAMMKKIDQESSGARKLLSQNISIVEVGAHSKVFEKFIDFIGVKTLIITDLDCGFQGGSEEDRKWKRCSASDSKVQSISNESLKYFLSASGKDNIEHYTRLKPEQKIVSKCKKKWSSDPNGIVKITFQTREKNYHARSFEDAFFHLNKEFILDEKSEFASLKKTYLKQYRDSEIDVFEFSEKAVSKKPSLAIEILLNSNTDEAGKEYSNWEIPQYIREGLDWLRLI